MHAFRAALHLAWLSILTTLALCSGTALAAPPGSPRDSCQLQSAGGQIHHVIYIQFDNVHLRRDNPNVPSD